MNILQVVPYVSYPPRMGGDHRSHGIVKEFPEFGDTVFRYCQGGSPGMYKDLDLRRRVEIAENYVEYRHLHPLHEATKVPMLLGYPNLLSGYSLRVASDGLADRIEWADVVIAREPWQFKTVHEMVPDDTPLVFSSHNVETERFGDIEQPLFEERIIEWVRNLEQYAVDHADAIITTSERDASVYEDEFGACAPTIVAPNGTYEDAIREHRPNSPAAQRLRQEYDIDEDSAVCLFMGSNYKPNVEAAGEVVRMARELPAVEFVIMGSVGNALSRREISENVTVTGYVEDDYEAHFDLADIALNPMISGGGTNIKLIDYFARSLPVVSTPFGVRGMGLTDEQDVFIAPIAEFDDAISSLKDSPSELQSVGTAANKIAREHYTWESSSQTVHSAVRDLIGPAAN